MNQNHLNFNLRIRESIMVLSYLINSVKSHGRIAAMCSALILSGCGLGKDVVGYDAGLNVGVDAIRTATEAHDLYKDNPDDPVALKNYSTALRGIGSHEKALQVIQDARHLINQSPALASEFVRVNLAMKALIEGERLARVYLNNFPGDFELRKLLAYSLAQQRNYTEAQEIFAGLIVDFPTDKILLNNYAMSLIMTHEIPKAIELLEEASSLPGSDPKTRQNLALALGLSGDFINARKILLRDLPSSIADKNLAYIKSIISTEGSEKAISTLFGPEKVNVEVKKAPKRKVVSSNLLDDEPLEGTANDNIVTGSISGISAEDSSGSKASSTNFTAAESTKKIPLPPNRIDLETRLSLLGGAGSNFVTNSTSNPDDEKPGSELLIDEVVNGLKKVDETDHLLRGVVLQ